MIAIRKYAASTAAVVSVALLARLIYLFLFFHGQPPHTARYLIGEETGSIAAAIAAGHGFSTPLYTPSGPTAWVTPIFPYLLAAVFKVFGTYTFHASVAIRSLNILFSALTCYPIILLGRRLFGNAAGLAAGWVWALLPTAIYFPVAWVWETSLAALTLTIALWMTYLIGDREDATAWTVYGFLWGFAALVSAAVLSVFPGCFLFALYRRKQRGGDWLRLGSFAALAFAVTVSPWIIRNQIVFHGKVLFRSNFGLELWLGNNPQVPDTWAWWLHPLDSPKEHEEFFRIGEIAYMHEKEQAAVQFIKTHPADVLRFQFHRFMETWTGNSDSFADIWSTHKPLLRAQLLLNYTLTIFAFLGLLFAHRKGPRLSLPLLNVVVVFPIVYYLCHTTARYRHPIDPVLAILSAYAVAHCARAIPRWAKSEPLKKRTVPATAD